MGYIMGGGAILSSPASLSGLDMVAYTILMRLSILFSSFDFLFSS